MSHLGVETRMQVTRALARMRSYRPAHSWSTTPIERDLESHLAALREVFNGVDVRYFRNPISHTDERFFERDGWLGTQPKSRILRGIRLLTSHAERLTSRVRAINDQAYFRCCEKLGSVQSQPFDLSGFTKVGDNLYAAPVD